MRFIYYLSKPGIHKEALRLTTKLAANRKEGRLVRLMNFGRRYMLTLVSTILVLLVIGVAGYFVLLRKGTWVHEERPPLIN